VNVDFQDVRTVVYKAGAAVMGAAETRGENRAINAAQEALASPLLDNKDIMGAQKILLSIISGEEAELQMDELTEITEYIQHQAGDDAEVIFGHGIDPDLKDRIRVTVIATGFAVEGRKQAKPADEKKVHDLDRSQGWLFEGAVTDNSIGGTTEPEMKMEVKEQKAEAPKAQPKEDSTDRGFVFTGPFVSMDNNHSHDDFNETNDDLFGEDEFDHTAEKYSDQTINEDGMMQLRSTKERLAQQAKERQSQLKDARKSEMSKEEFN
jgi:cell division protein FtsZ